MIVSASVESPMLGGDVDHSMTRAKANIVMSNEEDARGLSALRVGL